MQRVRDTKSRRVRWSAARRDGAEPPGIRNGFTLLELLAVIGVVAILVILLFAKAPAIIASGQSSKCMANLRVIGGALAAYSADYSGKILPRSADDVPAGEPQGWPRRLHSQGYINNPEVFYCPSFFPRNSREATKPISGDASQTYGMRGWALPGARLSNVGGGMNYHKPLSAVSRPSSFFIVADSVWTSSGWKSQGYGITPGNSSQRVHLRHQKLANTLFLDGHVEAKPAEYFETLHLPEHQKEYMLNTQTTSLEIYTTSNTDRENLP